VRPTPIRLIALFPTSEPDIVLGDRPAKEEHDVGEREAEFAAASACAWFGAPHDNHHSAAWGGAHKSLLIAHLPANCRLGRPTASAAAELPAWLQSGCLPQLVPLFICQRVQVKAFQL
jgi:hypothetical protein